MMKSMRRRLAVRGGGAGGGWARGRSGRGWPTGGKGWGQATRGRGGGGRRLSPEGSGARLRRGRQKVCGRLEGAGLAPRKVLPPAAIRRHADFAGCFGGGSHAGGEGGARGQLCGGGRAGSGYGR